MNCPKCNSPLLPDAKFCGSCGYSMNGSTYASSNNPPGGTFHFDSDGRGQGRGYTWSIEHQGAFELAVVQLQAEQSISAEAGAMVSMSANIDLNAELKGGVFGALKRAVGGETAFVSTFTAKGGPGEVTLAPGAPGAIAGIEMQNQVFMVQSSSYLAGDVSLQVDTKFGGARSFFGGEGLFLLQVSGAGLLLVSSFGAIHRKTLRPGEQYVVDTGHLVAWEASMPYNLRKATNRGFFRSMMSGEGLVAEFNGPRRDPDPDTKYSRLRRVAQALFSHRKAAAEAEDLVSASKAATLCFGKRSIDDEEWYGLKDLGTVCVEGDRGW